MTNEAGRPDVVDSKATPARRNTPGCSTRVHPSTAMKWLYAVERLALRAVAPRRAARRLRPTGAGSGSGRPLCAGGLVAARPLPPPNGHAIAVSGCAPFGRRALSLRKETESRA